MNETPDISLLPLINSPQINCLNEAHGHALSGIIASKTFNMTSAFLQSDLDEQLLLTIPFTQPVRIRSLIIKTASDVTQGPKVIKILINRRNIDFEDVQEGSESDVSQILVLTEDQVKEGKRIPLRFVRFQNVSSLHVFVESNQSDGNTTRIEALDIFGIPVEATKDLIGLKKQDDD
ncbi:DUF1000-domain-containing protein [Vararia minispora EC-137]|uniref:DUF1000-domain-containing protein n=1 Tax=Vararia minispora EC-137 TaxID=1314806 RepID=A0ACB8Q9I0_9AGAM|nr:DUF1000-domain-containing protein [Vararia minispora EC-137]